MASRSTSVSGRFSDDTQEHEPANSTNRAPRGAKCNGAHLWVFFAARVPAGTARRLGAILLRQAMARRAELDLASYDRLFPSQDFLPRKGIGNLIALPLQGRCRAAGTSVFLNPATLEPWPDQWAFLSSIKRVETGLLEHLAAAGEDLSLGAEGLGDP